MCLKINAFALSGRKSSYQRWPRAPLRLPWARRYFGLSARPCYSQTEIEYTPWLSIGNEYEVVWTFMKFKIFLCFWGVLGPWRRSVTSYTTDERSKNGQKERRRLNVEVLKQQIKSLSEKFRRLQKVLCCDNLFICAKRLVHHSFHTLFFSHNANIGSLISICLGAVVIIKSFSTNAFFSLVILAAVPRR